MCVYVCLSLTLFSIRSYGFKRKFAPLRRGFGLANEETLTLSWVEERKQTNWKREALLCLGFQVFALSLSLSRFDSSLVLFLLLLRRDWKYFLNFNLVFLGKREREKERNKCWLLPIHYNKTHSLHNFCTTYAHYAFILFSKRTSCTCILILAHFLFIVWFWF